MPTKKRREREQAWAKDAEETLQRHDRIFASPAGHIRDFPFDNLSDHADQGSPSPIAKLKHGLVDGDEFGNIFPNRKIIGSRQDTANKTRHEYQGRAAAGLKKRYPDVWGSRGSAKWIAHSESLHGRAVSVRTIQRYQKLYP